MKILIIGNYPPDQQYSLLGFRNVLQKELEARGFEVRVLFPDAQIIRWKGIPTKYKKWAGYIDKLVLFPNKLRKASEWADIVHICEHSNAVYTRHLQKIPHVVTCPDMMGIKAALGEIEGWSVGRTGRIYQNMILKGLCKAEYIVSISQTTQDDILRIASYPAQKTTLIYNGLFYPFAPMLREESNGFLEKLNIFGDTKFLMHVGQNSPTKNRIGMLKIYSALRKYPELDRMSLLMVGKPLTEELKNYICTHELQPHVIELIGLEDEEIRALYSRAEALIFPSLYEGFGMPVIEAQACGCPVFTSNRTPMTEVGGDAAVYFDPTKPDEAAQTITEHLPERETIVAAGFENVKRFTTERMIADYIKVYQKLLEMAPS